MAKIIKCEDCVCNLKGRCFLAPPQIHYIKGTYRDAGFWLHGRPETKGLKGCFSGIPKPQKN